MTNKISHPMNIKKVVKYSIDVNERSRKKIKASIEDILFASHIIAQNKGKLQATICTKLAKRLLEDRRDRKVSDLVSETVIDGNRFEGDLHEAMIIFDMFKRSGQIKLNEKGKLIPVANNNEIQQNIVTYPKNEPQTELEIRRGVENQKLPKAVRILSEVKYRIDKEIRDLAEDLGLYDYANNRILAESYKLEDEEFNTHYFADSRIRIYPNHASGHSPQGSDLGKAIIKNETKKATHDLTQDFIKMAVEFMDGKEPFVITSDNLHMLNWKDAEYPLRMKQLINDWNEYRWTGYTSANIDLDARCSGSQILSGLGRYSDITSHIGMEVEEDELDLYEKHALVFTEIVEEIAPEIIKRNPHLITEKVIDKILKKSVKTFVRKVAKRPTMTFVYNATLTSIIEEFRKKEINFNDSDIVEAAKLMQKALNKAAGGTALLMDWLKESASIISKSGAKTIQWTRPDGMIASQTYIKHKELRVKKAFQMTDQEIKMALLNGRKRPKTGWHNLITIQLQVPHLDISGQESSDSKKHVNGITANVVHSLDSCVAMKIIELLYDKGIQVTRFVHDSISVHMNHRQDLYNAIIDAHEWLFTSDFFENLKEEWELMYGVNLPQLPEKGDWDIKTLRKCKNFWN